MITENLSTLKIHNLTKEQYERELAAGRIDENALYLTPYEEVQPDWLQADPTASDFIKNKPVEMTNDDALNLLAELSVVEPITNENGAIYTNENGAIFTI